MDSSSQLQGVEIYKKEMVSSFEHFTNILSNLRKASDIKINLMKGNSTTVVLANRCVLEACSLQFTKLYESKQPEQGNVCQRSVINDLGCSLNEIDTVIDFIYTGRITLTLENVNSVLHLAGYFKIHTLLDTCCAYIKYTLRIETCIHLSLVLFKNEVAVEMNKELINLRKELEEYIRSHLSELIQNHHIYKFSAEDILPLLKAGCLSKVSDVGTMCQFAHMMLTRVQDTAAIKIAPMIVKSTLADVGKMSTADKLLLHSHLLTMNETALKCYGKEVFGESFKTLNDNLGVKTEREKDISDAAVIKDAINSAGINVSKIESFHKIGSVSDSKITAKLEDMEQTSIVTGVCMKPFVDSLVKKTGQAIDFNDGAKREGATGNSAVLVDKKDSLNALGNISDGIRTSTAQDKHHVSLVVDFRKVPQYIKKDKRKDSGATQHHASLQQTVPGTDASTKDLSVNKALNESTFNTTASAAAAQLSSTCSKVATIVRKNDKNKNRPAGILNVLDKIVTNENIHGQQLNKYFDMKTESNDVPMNSTMPDKCGELNAVTEDVVTVKTEPVDTWTETSDYGISRYQEGGDRYTEMYFHDDPDIFYREKSQFIKLEKGLPSENSVDRCHTDENVQHSYIETEIKVEKVTDEDGYQIGFLEGNEQQSLMLAVEETGGYNESYCQSKELCILAEGSSQDIIREQMKRKENQDTRVTYKKMKMLKVLEDVRKMNNLSARHSSVSSHQNSEKVKGLKKVSVIPKSRIKVVKR